MDEILHVWQGRPGTDEREGNIFTANLLDNVVQVHVAVRG